MSKLGQLRGQGWVPRSYWVARMGHTVAMVRGSGRALLRLDSREITDEWNRLMIFIKPYTPPIDLEFLPR